MPLPATKTATLLEQINSAHEPTPFQIASWREQAEKARSVSVAEGDMLLGMIAAITDNAAETRKRFSNAIAFMGKTDSLLYNYGLALSRLGLFAEAIQVLLEKADYDKSCAELMAMVCAALGLQNKARHYYLNSLQPDQDAGNFEEFYRLNSDAPSPLRDMAFQAIHDSYALEPEVWEYLSRH